MDGRGRASSSSSSSSSTNLIMHAPSHSKNIPGFHHRNHSKGGAGGSSSSATDENAPISCVHYVRKCKIVAPCCGKIFGCRICHDESMVTTCGPMDRFKIQEIICKECNTRQLNS